MNFYMPTMSSETVGWSAADIRTKIDVFIAQLLLAAVAAVPRISGLRLGTARIANEEKTGDWFVRR